MKFKENKRLKNFIIAFILLIITYILMIVLSKNNKGFNKDIPVISVLESTRENKDIKKVLQDELYVVQNITEKNEIYEINVFYPESKSQVLNSYIKNKIDLYIKDIKYQANSHENDARKGKYKLDINFYVTEGENGYVSFIFVVRVDTKWFHINEYFFVVNYDYKSDKLITQEMIEKQYKNLYVNLSNHTYNHLSQNEAIKKMGAIDMLKDGTKASRYNFLDIAFDGKDMLVLFEKYQVAPYVLGSFEVKVSLEDLMK
ncbi:MAG: hypothetical protein PHR25_02860 [Clostridia bacterium]|nr:hypothetical protein [Clostridia bacterium]MDD4375701.1 hypothetical protein [Clostridia bacterium]